MGPRGGSWDACCLGGLPWGTGGSHFCVHPWSKHRGYVHPLICAVCRAEEANAVGCTPHPNAGALAATQHHVPPTAEQVVQPARRRHVALHGCQGIGSKVWSAALSDSHLRPTPTLGGGAYPLCLPWGFAQWWESPPPQP